MTLGWYSFPIRLRVGCCAGPVLIGILAMFLQRYTTSLFVMVSYKKKQGHQSIGASGAQTQQVLQLNNSELQYLGLLMSIHKF